MYILVSFATRIYIINDTKTNKIMHSSKKINIAIQHFRREKRLSQDEFATLLGINRMTVSRWESGLVKDYEKVLFKIEKAFPDEDFSDLQNLISGVSSKFESNVESKTKESAMVDCGSHIISKNQQGNWERYIKTTGEIEVDIDGNWVKKSELITPPPPRG